MSNFNQPAYPTTPEHHGYPSGIEDVHMYSGSGLSKLQRIASEQLAALVLATYSTDWSPSLEDADFIPDASGNWGKAPNGMWGSGGSCGSGHRLVTTHEQRVTRIAVEYAKALLEMTE